MVYPEHNEPRCALPSELEHIQVGYQMGQKMGPGLQIADQKEQER